MSFQLHSILGFGLATVECLHCCPQTIFHWFGINVLYLCSSESHIWARVETLSRLIQVFIQSFHVATGLVLWCRIYFRKVSGYILAEKQPKNHKISSPWFTVGTCIVLRLKASLIWRQRAMWPRIYSFVSYHHCTDDQNFTSLSNFLITKDRRALIRIFCRRGAVLCLQPMKPSFLFSMSSVMLT